MLACTLKSSFAPLFPLVCVPVFPINPYSPPLSLVRTLTINQVPLPTPLRLQHPFFSPFLFKYFIPSPSLSFFPFFSFFKITVRIRPSPVSPSPPLLLFPPFVFISFLILARLQRSAVSSALYLPPPSLSLVPEFCRLPPIFFFF